MSEEKVPSLNCTKMQLLEVNNIRNTIILAYEEVDEHSVKGFVLYTRCIDFDLCGKYIWDKKHLSPYTGSAVIEIDERNLWRIELK